MHTGSKYSSLVLFPVCCFLCLIFYKLNVNIWRYWQLIVVMPMFLILFTAIDVYWFINTRSLKSIMILPFYNNISRPDLIVFEDLDPDDHVGNLNTAFEVASEKLGISKILDADGMSVFNILVSHICLCINCSDRVSVKLF